MTRTQHTLKWVSIVAMFALQTWNGASAQALSSPEHLLCPDAKIWGSTLVRGVCWSCLFPMRLMGIVQFGKGDIPEGASKKSVCACEGNGDVKEYGFTLGFWQPARLVELVRQPYCSPTLGGTVMRKSFRSWGMKDGANGGSSSNQFYNYHYFAFPLYEILELLNAPQCNADGYFDLDLMYLSELDPTWSEEELAMFTNPESAVAANPLMQAAGVADGAMALGTWQGLYIAEHRAHPHRREVILQFLGRCA